MEGGADSNDMHAGGEQGGAAEQVVKSPTQVLEAAVNADVETALEEGQRAVDDGKLPEDEVAAVRTRHSIVVLMVS